MNKYQTYILWIGLVIVLVYLFTDSSVRDAIFGRNASASTASNVTLTSVETSLGATGENTVAPVAGSHPKIQTA
jgi:hypothetical protein